MESLDECFFFFLLLYMSMFKNGCDVIIVEVLFRTFGWSALSALICTWTTYIFW